MEDLPEDLVVLIFDYKHQLESRAIVYQIKKTYSDCAWKSFAQTNDRCLWWRFQKGEYLFNWYELILKCVEVPPRVQWGYAHMARPLMVRNPETGLLALNYYWAHFRDLGIRPRSHSVRSYLFDSL